MKKCIILLFIVTLLYYNNSRADDYKSFGDYGIGKTPDNVFFYDTTSQVGISAHHIGSRCDYSSIDKEYQKECHRIVDKYCDETTWKEMKDKPTNYPLCVDQSSMDINFPMENRSSTSYYMGQVGDFYDFTKKEGLSYLTISNDYGFYSARQHELIDIIQDLSNENYLYNLRTDRKDENTIYSKYKYSMDKDEIKGMQRTYINHNAMSVKEDGRTISKSYKNRRPTTSTYTDMFWESWSYNCILIFLYEDYPIKYISDICQGGIWERSDKKMI